MAKQLGTWAFGNGKVQRAWTRKLSENQSLANLFALLRLCFYIFLIYICYYLSTGFPVYLGLCGNIFLQLDRSTKDSGLAPILQKYLSAFLVICYSHDPGLPCVLCEDIVHRNLTEHVKLGFFKHVYSRAESVSPTTGTKA